jgi:hypothetical protein
MESNVSSRSSSPEPAAKPVISAVKEKKPRPPITDKQKESLRKGMEALKLKREQLAKEKEERKKTNEELKAKGLPPIEPPIKIKKQDITELPKLEPVKIEVKTRKPRSDKGMPRPDRVKEKIDTIAEIKKMVLDLQAKQEGKVIEKPVEVIKEVPVVKEKEVIKEKVLSGSDLLNKIFFAK